MMRKFHTSFTEKNLTGNAGVLNIGKFAKKLELPKILDSAWTKKAILDLGDVRFEATQIQFENFWTYFSCFYIFLIHHYNKIKFWAHLSLQILSPFFLSDN